MDQYDAGELSDTDPKAQELMKEIKRLWDEAPVVKSLDGQRVKLPGFVVPLEMNAKSINEFLLVPYYGALHPCPAATDQPDGACDRTFRSPFEGELFDTVWVTGELTVEKYSNDMVMLAIAFRQAASSPMNDTGGDSLTQQTGFEAFVPCGRFQPGRRRQGAPLTASFRVLDQ